MFGNISTYKYDVHRGVDKLWTDGRGISHATYHVKGISRVTMSLQVIELKTGLVLAAKTISKESVQESTEKDAWPSDPDGDAVMVASVNATVDTFVKMITPHTEYVKVVFAKGDTNIPEITRGINFAKTGQWADAVHEFKIATEKNPLYQGAFWNLGLAYEYSNMFDKAEDSFRKADKIKHCEKCIKEIANVKQLAAERNKLEEQGSLKTTQD